MENIIFDEIIIFGEHANDNLEEAISMCGCAEEFEQSFGLELSCGDGLFLPDIDEDEELMAQYDGLVCKKSPPRYSDTKKLLDVGRKYRFTITNPDESPYIKDCLFYINGQMVNR
jgi:hypothetical protein